MTTTIVPSYPPMIQLLDALRNGEIEQVFPEPEPNLELLRLVFKTIDAEPERWNQTSWATAAGFTIGVMDANDTAFCGTSFCAAGWAIELSGQHEFMFEHPDDMNGTVTAEMCVDRETGEHEYIETAARRLLGLTPEEAYSLFAAENSREDLEIVADQIAARVGAEL